MKNNKQVTAVECLYKEMYSMFCTPDMIVEFEDILKQAKEMHKQEILDAYIQGRDDWSLDWYPEKHAKEYYQETFKSE
jgi:hypothetical protein